MLEYVKTILQKVSFDSRLFEKELKKAISTVLNTELSDLRDWCYQNFGGTYKRILDKCFA